MRTAIFLSAMIVSAGANAACFGSNSFQTCTDTAGNSYSVQRYGDSTMMRGYNAGTGSSWSQNSYSFGDTTQHYGQTNGRTWSMQENRIGDYRTYSGTDWYGNSFSGSCYGLNCD